MEAEGGAHDASQQEGEEVEQKGRNAVQDRQGSARKSRIGKRDEDWTIQEEILTNLISAGIRKQTKRIPLQMEVADGQATEAKRSCSP